MKILYASDIHAGFEMLDIFTQYAKKTKPDLIEISGDLVNFSLLKQTSKGLEPLSNAYHPQIHEALFNILMNYAQENEPGLKRLKPYEIPRAIPIIAEKIYENLPDKNLEALMDRIGLEKELGSEKLVEEYLNSLDFAEGNMDIQYDLLKTILDQTGIEYQVIPGNYDKDLQLTSLKESDLHNKVLEKDNIRIAGFGGANDFQHGDITFPGIPVELTIPFNEYPNQAGQTMSDIFNFLIKEKPDIAFTHMPPREIRDSIVDSNTKQMLLKSNPKLSQHLNKGGPAALELILKSENQDLIKLLRKVGSPGLTQYLMQGHTPILCCGHVHEAVGVEKISLNDDNHIVVFNGGSLKEGYFGEIHIDEETKKLDKISLYQIKGKLILPEDVKENLDVNNVSLLAEYFLTKDGQLKKIKIDLNDEHDY